MLTVAVDIVSDFCVVFHSYLDYQNVQVCMFLLLCNTLQIKVEWCNCCVLIQCAEK